MVDLPSVRTSCCQPAGRAWGHDTVIREGVDEIVNSLSWRPNACRCPKFQWLPASAPTPPTTGSLTANRRPNAVSASRTYGSGDGGKDRHNRHASGECDGQGEDYGYLLHWSSPFCRHVSNIHRLAWLSSAHYCSLAYSTYTLVRDESGPQPPRVSRPREKFPRWFPAKPFAAGHRSQGTSAGFASSYLSDSC